MSIEAMKLALEAMTYADACLKKQLTTKTKHVYAQCLLLEAGTALLQAIEQAEQAQPVAWIYEDELPESYPYDAMFEKSRVIEGVRMFPTNVTPPRQPEKLGFAGVTVWIDDLTITHVVTEMEIKYEKETGQAITHAAQFCLNKISRPRR